MTQPETSANKLPCLRRMRSLAPKEKQLFLILISEFFCASAVHLQVSNKKKWDLHATCDSAVIQSAVQLCQSSPPRSTFAWQHVVSSNQSTVTKLLPGLPACRNLFLHQALPWSNFLGHPTSLSFQIFSIDWSNMVGQGGQVSDAMVGFGP